MSLCEPSLDQLLERCLQELLRTGDVEVALQLCPQHADQLRPLLEMALITHSYYADVPEAPGGLTTGRERFMSIAAQPRATKGSKTSNDEITTAQAGRIKLSFAMRLVAVLLTVFIGATALGYGVAWTASESLPGDLLYPVKMTTEDTRLALASTPEERLGLTLQFVEERVEEIRALVNAGGQVPDVAVARMEQHIEQVLVNAAWSSDEQMDDMLRQIAMHTRTQAQALEQVESIPSQYIRVKLERAAMVCWHGFTAAESGLSDPRAFRLLYRHERGTPVPTDVPELATPTEDDCKDEDTPASPSVTPETPQPTPEPRSTPQDPQPTLEPQPVPPEKDPQPALEPQPTISGQGQQSPSGQQGPLHPSKGSN